MWIRLIIITKKSFIILLLCVAILHKWDRFFNMKNNIAIVCKNYVLFVCEKYYEERADI